jgi:GDP-4-dehydro-6-deoxy-D-mannose reductase
VSSFARQIAMIEAGRQPPIISVGNLAARRDFLDVRDVVRAYMALMAKGEPGQAYNVCSGNAISIQEILNWLLAHARVAISVERDPSRFLPLDVPTVVGNPYAVRKATGWVPQIPIDRTLADVLEYWRAQTPFVGDATTSFA